MRITLKKLSLLNFKGIRSLDIDFNTYSNVSGDNGTGKSTIADSFTWLLFGKNQEDKKDFNVKTLNPDNTPIHKLEHSVTGVLDIDGREETFKRVLKEKWVKKRGEEETEFTGHETLYYVNDVPLSAGDYNKKVSELLSEDIAKIITNPLYFNTMKWESRRAILTKMAGEISDADICEGNEDFRKLLDFLGNKSLTAYKKEIAERKKKLKVDLTAIPTRIDEAERSKPESDDFVFIEKAIENKQKLVAKAEQAITDKAEVNREAGKAIIEKQNELHRLKMKLSNLEAEAKEAGQKEIRNLESNIRELKSKQQSLIADINFNKGAIERHNANINNLNKENDSIRAEWTTLNAQTAPSLGEDDKLCPSCHQSLPEGEISTLKEKLELNFNSDKSKKLSALNSKGVNNKIEIERLQKLIESLEKNNEKFLGDEGVIDETIPKLEKEREMLTGAVDITAIPEIEVLKEKIAAFKIPDEPVVDYTELKQRKTELTTEIDALKNRLINKERIATIVNRIKELEAEEKQLAQQLASLERTEFQIDKFNKTKIDMVSERVNKMFTMVTFKMFAEQINGGTEPCCETLINGIPFSDANNAGKINAGIDIINSVCKYYNLHAPIFVDNAEAVNQLLPSESQIIRLIVTTDKKLFFS